MKYVKLNFKAVKASFTFPVLVTPATVSTLVANSMEHFNLTKYPIHLRGSDAYKSLVASARESLEKDGCCRLQNFILPAAVLRMQVECGSLVGAALGNQYGRSVNCWYSKGDSSLPQAHPLNVHFAREFGVIRDDMIGENDVVRQVYNNLHLIRFVADILGVPSLYQSRDSYQALTVNVMTNGEHLHWHFDCNECAVTLGIQEPEGGGELEFVPNIGRHNYESIAEIFEEDNARNRAQHSSTTDCLTHLLPTRDFASGPLTASPKSGRIQRHSYQTTAGTLIFFRGYNSLHRVCEVKGSTPRLVAALQFHTSADAFDSPETTRRIYGVPVSEHLAPKPPRGV